MIKVGVIGYGYWGPNLVRNFMAAPGSAVTRVCDMRKSAFRLLGNSIRRQPGPWPYVQRPGSPVAAHFLTGITPT